MSRLFGILFMALVAFCVTPAIAKDANPLAADLFEPYNPGQETFLESIGPGHGHKRIHSDRADVHQDVEGFSPARRCLTCHEGQENNLHYARTELVCRDCHVTKPVAGINNPQATIYREHRHEQVCGRCHEGASFNMASYVIHERSPWSGQARDDFPALFWSFVLMVALAGTVFAIFLPYTVAWAIRDFGGKVKATLTSGRLPSPGREKRHISRFSPIERWFHTLLVICFMLLSITGIGWMYIENDFGQGLVAPFGGYEGAILVHRIFGLVLMVVFVAHIVWLFKRIAATSTQGLTGPDSIVWTWADFKAFWQHLKWVVGIGPYPVFDRWTWWQKFDYWAVWWGIVIVGSTGLVLFDPVLTSKVFPGWTMNVARWIHKIEAILAMGHIFVVHFFIESYRPKAFPLNDHVFHGAAPLDHMAHEHPAWVERLEQDGGLENLMTRQPPRAVQLAFFGFGASMIVLGSVLLVGMLAYATQLSF